MADVSLTTWISFALVIRLLLFSKRISRSLGTNVVRRAFVKCCKNLTWKVTGCCCHKSVLSFRFIFFYVSTRPLPPPRFQHRTLWSSFSKKKRKEEGIGMIIFVRTFNCFRHDNTSRVISTRAATASNDAGPTVDDWWFIDAADLGQ